MAGRQPLVVPPKNEGSNIGAALAQSVSENAQGEENDLAPLPEPSFHKTVSTGSTLLDMAISGLKTPQGGLPGGILVEIYGASSAGKTAIMAELGGNAIANGGKVAFKDPEGRLDAEYSSIYGMPIDEILYSRPNTVVETFDEINEFLVENQRENDDDPINVCVTDSIAALTTDIEMSETRDKMGMKKAKDLSQETRRSARLIANSGNVVICSNQLREGQEGQEVTSGGKAIGYYASVRMRIKLIKKLEKTMKIGLGSNSEGEVEETAKTRLARGMKKEKAEKGSAKEVSKVIGIMSEVEVVKSSVDHPFRKAIVMIKFGYGIDDIGANLQYLKDMRNDSVYRTPDGKGFQGLEQATLYVEEAGLIDDLKEEVRDVWKKVENAFRSPRQPKKR